MGRFKSRPEDEANAQLCVSRDMSASILKNTCASGLADLRNSPHLDKVTGMLLNRRPLLHVVCSGLLACSASFMYLCRNERMLSVFVSLCPSLHPFPVSKQVVLFAADMRVRKYSEEVQEAFLRAGIHVYVQMELEGKQLRNCSASPAYIRPEHLLEVIASSLADYLIVLGLFLP